MCLLQKSQKMNSLQIDPKSVGNLDYDIYFLIRLYLSRFTQSGSFRWHFKFSWLCSGPQWALLQKSQKMNSLQIVPKSVGNLDYDIYFLIRLYLSRFTQSGSFRWHFKFSWLCSGPQWALWCYHVSFIFIYFYFIYFLLTFQGHQDMCICWL